MDNKKVLRDFLKYVSLNILGQAAYSCYTLADTFFVSASLGADGLTALNLAFPVFCLINGIGLMIGIGGGTGYSIQKSRKEKEEADAVFSNAVYIALFFSLLFFLSGIFLSRTITKALGADTVVFSLTHTYLQVLLLFSPAFLMNNLLHCFIRNDGNPSLSMVAMISASISNVVLDYIFIFPLHMGIFGAILATGLSPIISMIILSFHFIRGKNHFHFGKKLLKLRVIPRILSTGISPLVTELTSGIVMLLFNFLILHIAGNIAVAAFSIITVISLVIVAIYTGLSQGIQPLLSLNHGLKDTHSIKALWKYAMLTMIVLSVVIYTIIFFYSQQLATIFNREYNEKLQELAITGLKLYFIACPFMGFNIVSATYFTSTERRLPSQVISLSRGFFILIPMAFLLSALFEMTGVWCTYPLTEFITALIGVAVYIEYKKCYQINLIAS